MPAITRWLVLVVAAVFMAACSDSSADPSSVSPGPTTVTSPSTTTAPTPTTATPSPGRQRCPLTAEDVSEAIGTTVFGPESPTNCYFDYGSPFPSVGFGYLPASACTQESLRQNGYAEGELTDVGPVDEFDFPAYAKRMSLGVNVIFCNGDQPFEVRVDGVTTAHDVVAAVALAKLVLNG